MSELDIIRALREACLAAEPIVELFVSYPQPYAHRRAVRCVELIEHALSLEEGKPPVTETTQELFNEIVTWTPAAEPAPTPRCSSDELDA